MFENHISPWMDEELHIMRDAVHKFLAREFVPHMARWEKQGCIDRDAWNKAGTAGLLCVSIPAQYGGGGGGGSYHVVMLVLNLLFLISFTLICFVYSHQIQRRQRLLDVVDSSNDIVFGTGREGTFTQEI